MSLSQRYLTCDQLSDSVTRSDRTSGRLDEWQVFTEFDVKQEARAWWST